MTHTYIDTRKYELTYHHRPRGRGSWVFFFDGDEDINTAFCTPGSTMYTEAKKLAKAEAKRRGARRVTVGT